MTSDVRLSTVHDARMIDLPRILDPRGNLTFIEGGRQIPFDFTRVFYLYDVPGGETRAGHANRELEQLIIAVSGSFDVIIDDGAEQQSFSLNRSYFGLYVPGMLWRDIKNFSSGSVCLVLASDFYDEEDYYRDYGEYQRAQESRRAAST
jgi:dTDP-4-dehydrorhamnose 3,5-epimerase-like enzyme